MLLFYFHTHAKNSWKEASVARFLSEQCQGDALYIFILTWSYCGVLCALSSLTYESQIFKRVNMSQKPLQLDLYVLFRPFCQSIHLPAITRNSPGELRTCLGSLGSVCLLLIHFSMAPKLPTDPSTKIIKSAFTHYSGPGQCITSANNPRLLCNFDNIVFI